MSLVLTLINASTLLLFGVFLSFAFSGIKLNRRNIISGIMLCILCGLLQGIFYMEKGETLVWKIYPLITHLPIILYLKLYFRKRIVTSCNAVLTAYLFCQPSKWARTLTEYFTDDTLIHQAIYTGILIITAIISLRFLATCLSSIYNSDDGIAPASGMVPAVYYLFDYSMVIFPHLWTNNLRIAIEFLPFFICIMFIVFNIVYYKENERKSDAQRKEQLIRITVEQQAKELEAIKRGANELRILRHDLRLFLSSLSVCINQGEDEVAKDLITSYSNLIEGTKAERFCTFDTINYVLSDFNSKCKADNVSFVYKIELKSLNTDEVLLSSILSNALDNALNAQKKVPEDKRSVQLVMKEWEGKLLLSVKNPYAKEPVFINGLPVATREGHGTGVRSICYMTEKLNGNYQFSAKDGMFITRVII